MRTPERSMAAPAWFVLAAILSVGSQCHSVQADTVPIAGKIFRIQIASDKQRYKDGEPVRLRLSITNLTDQEYRFQYWPPWRLCDLQIIDAQGTLLTTPGSWGAQGSWILIHVKPGLSVAASFWDNESNQMSEWADLKFWGYHLGPGSYTITAIPEIYGFGYPDKGSLGTFAMPKSEESEPIALTVTP